MYICGNDVNIYIDSSFKASTGKVGDDSGGWRCQQKPQTFPNAESQPSGSLLQLIQLLLKVSLSSHTCFSAEQNVANRSLRSRAFLRFKLPVN